MPPREQPKDLTVLAIDAGPDMTKEDLDLAVQYARAVIRTALDFKPRDEIGVIAYGSSVTNNDLHVQNMNEGDDSQYLNIATLLNLNPVEAKSTSALSSISPGPEGTRADYIDAITVATDMLLLRESSLNGMGKLGVKRVVLVSNLRAEAALGEEDAAETEEYLRTMTGTLVTNRITMEVCEISAAEDDDPAIRDGNLRTLTSVVEPTSGAVRAVCNVRDMWAQLPASKPVSLTTTYTGSMQITPAAAVSIKAYKKVKADTFPKGEMYSNQDPDPSASHKVKLDRTYKSEADEAMEVGPEGRVRAYKYGKQRIPVSNMDASVLNYSPEKGVRLLGFLPSASLGPHLFLKETSIVLADPGSPPDIAALSSLVRAMDRRGSVAVVRAVWRKGANVQVGALTPIVGDPEAKTPDALAFNVLPFREDARMFTFPSFDDAGEDTVTLEQYDAANALILASDLMPEGEEEMLRPEDTVNPSIHAARELLHHRCVDPGAPVPLEHTAMDDAVLQPPPELAEAAREEREAVKRVFEMVSLVKERGREGRGRPSSVGGKDFVAPDLKALEGGEGEAFDLDAALSKVVTSVGTTTPVDDFRALVEGGKDREAVRQAEEELQAAVFSLIETGVGAMYTKASGCMECLRAHCTGNGAAEPYNGLLRQLGAACRGGQHAEFWQPLEGRGLGLITSEEAKGSGVSGDDAREFWRAQEAAPSQAAAADVGDEDFEDFE